MERRRVHLRSITFNGVVAGGLFAMAAGAFVSSLSDPPAGSKLDETSRILSAAFGVIVAVSLSWLGLRAAKVRVEADGEELLVVNPFRRHSIPWHEVQAIEIGTRPFFGMMAYVRLSSGVTVWLMALSDEIPFRRLARRVDALKRIAAQSTQIGMEFKTEVRPPKTQTLWLLLTAAVIGGIAIGLPLVLETSWLFGIGYLVGGLVALCVVAIAIARKGTR